MNFSCFFTLRRLAQGRVLRGFRASPAGAEPALLTGAVVARNNHSAFQHQWGAIGGPELRHNSCSENGLRRGRKEKLAREPGRSRFDHGAPMAVRGFCP